MLYAIHYAVYLVDTELSISSIIYKDLPAWRSKAFWGLRPQKTVKTVPFTLASKSSNKSSLLRTTWNFDSL